MKKRILFLVACFAVVFTAMAYMDVNTGVVDTASATNDPRNGMVITNNMTYAGGQISVANAEWTFNSDVTLTLNGTITIPNGRTLTINGPGTIKSNTNNDLFLVKQGGTLIINNVVINGNSKCASGAAIHLDVPNNYYPNSRTARLTLNSVTIKDCKRTSRMGGAIKFGDDNAYNHLVECTITDSIIDNCDAPQGSAIMLHTNCKGNILIKATTIRNCDSTDSYAGTIRTQGNANCKLRIESCTITNNKSALNGGGVYWNARGSEAGLTITGTKGAPTIISNNTAKYGGGVFLSGSSITIEETQIIGNSAEQGGGICMQPYDYSGSSSGKGCNLTLSTGAKVLDNEAKDCGGGIYLQIDSGSTTDHEDFNININDDATIQGNKAKNGGAFAVTQKTGNAEYSGGSKRKYDAYINVNSGTITGNEATGDGGAFYINRAYGNEGTGYELKVNISGGNIYGNKATNNGGAIYLTDNATNSNAQVKVNGGTIGADGKANTASNGGAVYINGGNFEMSGGDVAYNQATTNGGAVYVTGGSVTMTNGELSDNTAANGGGGAVYVNNGEFTVEHGTLTGNKALKGGAAYVYGGDFIMKSGTMSNNEATYSSPQEAENGSQGYGGAVYANGGDIYIGILNCKLTDPVDAHKEGQQTHHPIITENKAAFGGGLAVNSGHVHIYCCDFENNHALSNGTGQNIFMSGTDGEIHHYIDGAVIGQMKDHGMVSIGGQLYVYQDGEFVTVSIKYHSNFSVGMTWEGKAPEDYYLNLPYCPQEWSDSQAQKQLVFAGWAETSEGTKPDQIRNKDDYEAIGDPIEIIDTPIGEPIEINFYALWAPKVNAINYAYSLDGENISVPASEDESIFRGYAKEYTYENYEYSIEDYNTDPEKPGYKFKEWKMYANKDKVSNWGADAETDGDVTLVSQLISPMPWDPMGTFEQNFGDITLVAIFEPAYTDLVIEKDCTVGTSAFADSEKEFLFIIEGTPADKSIGKINLAVTVGADGVEKIKNLPVGEYEITEITDWSWRYDYAKEEVEFSTVKDDKVTKENVSEEDILDNGLRLDVTNPEVTYNLKFTNELKRNIWLTENDYNLNYFNPVTYLLN